MIPILTRQLNCSFKKFKACNLSFFSRLSSTQAEQFDTDTNDETQEQEQEIIDTQAIGTGKKYRINVEPLKHIDDELKKPLKERSFTHKNRPGKFYLGKIDLPENRTKVIQKILHHQNYKEIAKNSAELFNYLKSRRLPVEARDIQKKADQLEEKIASQDEIFAEFMSEREREKRDRIIITKVRNRLKRTVYHWEPINYDEIKVIEYLIARTPAEYSAIYRVFSELAMRDKDFTPTTLFDFGSGLGTVTWAAYEFWKKSIREYYCVDSSRDMIDMAELILRHGSMKNSLSIPNVYFRQFLPANSMKFDIVTSAYSLLELPSTRDRIGMIHDLWKMTNNYLILIEQGTNAGFEALNEARDFVLRLDLKSEEKDEQGNESEVLNELNEDPKESKKVKVKKGHVYSPCPNDTWCPRFLMDLTPCNFKTTYRKLLPFSRDVAESEYYSYVILKRGSRQSAESNWPRIVRDPIPKKGHLICRVCTSKGNLNEVILTKTKPSSELYKLLKKSRWGDLLPVKVITEENKLDESKPQSDESDEQDDFSNDEVKTSQ